MHLIGGLVVLVAVAGALAVPSTQQVEVVTKSPHGRFFDYFNPFSWFEEEDNDNEEQEDTQLSKDKLIYRVLKCLLHYNTEKCKKLMEAADKIFGEKGEATTTTTTTSTTTTSTTTTATPTSSESSSSASSTTTTAAPTTSATTTTEAPSSTTSATTTTTEAESASPAGP